MKYLVYLVLVLPLCLGLSSAQTSSDAIPAGRCREKIAKEIKYAQGQERYWRAKMVADRQPEATMDEQVWNFVVLDLERLEREEEQAPSCSIRFFRVQPKYIPGSDNH
jgi:hypothetical protein